MRTVGRKLKISLNKNTCLLYQPLYINDMATPHLLSHITEIESSDANKRFL